MCFRTVTAYRYSINPIFCLTWRCATSGCPVIGQKVKGALSQRNEEWVMRTNTVTPGFLMIGFPRNGSSATAVARLSASSSVADGRRTLSTAAKAGSTASAAGLHNQAERVRRSRCHGNGKNFS